MKTRISTQVYVLVDGDRKQMDFTGPDGVARTLRVDIDLTVCDRCSAVVDSLDAHAAWHAEQVA